uniref:Uncharacterized protein n=1 Tax=Anguilla anguilla TaxID=7936 RepID=A0A0E9UXD8_ANGAN
MLYLHIFRVMLCWLAGITLD